MDKGIYVAMSGASATLKAQAAVAHNLANVDSTGFKAALIQQQPFVVGGPGLASRIDTVTTTGGFDDRSGPVIDTGNPLDVALHENAWLAVQDSSGGEAYTRAGSLEVSRNGQLVTSSGRPLLGESGLISVPPYQAISIGGDGTVSIVPQGQGPETQAVVGRLRVVKGDSTQLVRGVDGLMRRSDGSAPDASAGSVLSSGAIEGSNVNAADALVSMIELSRQFDMQIKALHTTDENAQSANSLLRLGS